MDRTAIASIVIGVGATIAAMVFPTKYPSAPKWAVNVSWWGGLFFIATGTAYLITEHPLSDLSGAVLGALNWLYGYVVAVQELPGFWIAVAFASGIITHKKVVPAWRERRERRNPPPLVSEWLSPAIAVERFVGSDLLGKSRKAEADARGLREIAEKVAADLEHAPELEKHALRTRLDAALDVCTDKEYMAKHRRIDVMNDLYRKLKSGELVAKGYRVKWNDQLKKEPSYIETLYWGGMWRLTDLEDYRHLADQDDVLDIETGRAWNLMGSYQRVLIGRNEAFRPPVALIGPPAAPLPIQAPQGTQEKT